MRAIKILPLLFILDLPRFRYGMFHLISMSEKMYLPRWARLFMIYRGEHFKRISKITPPFEIMEESNYIFRGAKLAHRITTIMPLSLF